MKLFAAITVSALLSHSAAPANADAPDAPDAVQQSYGGRSLFVFAPSKLPAPGTRSLVVVLHGGLGNAERIVAKQAEHGLNLDTVAEQNGFIVAYLNGTPVTRYLGDDKLGWNAGGGCCGVSASRNIDDVKYISGAVDYLIAQFGVDRNRVYGIGHSNGAMMTLRMVCETGLYAAAISIAGPLNLEPASCPAAKGKRVLDLHGERDENVPIAGGVGARGLSRVDFKSEQYTQQVFNAAGADFQLQIVRDADHFLNHIGEAIQRDEGQSLQQKVVHYFRLEADTSPPTAAAESTPSRRR